MEDLAWFKPWTPLAHVPFEARLVAEGLYAVDKTTYLFTVPYNRTFEVDDLAPYVTFVLFAPDDGAAERCVHGKLSADSGAPLCIEALNCLSVDDWSYEGLSHLSGSREAAEYGSDGKFLHIRLEWTTPSTRALMKAYYRDRKIESSDLPYAVQYRGPVVPHLH